MSQIELKTFSKQRLSSSFEHFICSLFEQLNSNWHGTSMPPHSCMLTMSSATDHFIQENTTLFGRTRKANGWTFHRPFDFHAVFVHGVVKLSFSNKCFSDRWLPCASINMISTHTWCEREVWEGDGRLLHDSAQASSNVFFFPANQSVHSWATY